MCNFPCQHSLHVIGRNTLTQHTNTRKVILPKLPPQRLVEATNPIVCVRRTLSIRDTVEEMPIISTLLPHPLHLGRAGLEVAKVLLAQSRLLIHLDFVSRERRRRRIVRGQRAEDALGRLAGATVGGGEEVEGVFWFEEGAELAPCFVGLVPAIVGEFDAVVGDVLVDITVFYRKGLV